jgi:hypothetical protein
VYGVNLIAIKQDTLTQGGLARIYMRANPDIPHLFYIDAHQKTLLNSKNEVSYQLLCKSAKNPSKFQARQPHQPHQWGFKSATR